jgi:GNAT superfamily N-acetyltransferase
MNIQYCSSDIVYKDEAIYKRLCFLTNGGWGRHPGGSGMLEWLEGRRLGHIWLVWHKEQIIAWSAISNTGMVAVYVQRKYRRQGIGFALASKMANFAKVRSFNIYCDAWNQAAVRTYAKAGCVNRR